MCNNEPWLPGMKLADELLHRLRFSELTKQNQSRGTVSFKHVGDVPLNLTLLRWLLYIHAYMLAYVVDDEALPAQRDMAGHMVHRTEW